MSVADGKEGGELNLAQADVTQIVARVRFGYFYFVIPERMEGVEVCENFQVGSFGVFRFVYKRLVLAVAAYPDFEFFWKVCGVVRTCRGPVER